jgi:hypothetical protein
MLCEDKGRYNSGVEAREFHRLTETHRKVGKAWNKLALRALQKQITIPST